MFYRHSLHITFNFFLVGYFCIHCLLYPKIIRFEGTAEKENRSNNILTLVVNQNDRFALDFAKLIIEAIYSDHKSHEDIKHFSYYIDSVVVVDTSNSYIINYNTWLLGFNDSSYDLNNKSAHVVTEITFRIIKYFDVDHQKAVTNLSHGMKEEMNKIFLELLRLINLLKSFGEIVFSTEKATFHLVDIVCYVAYPLFQFDKTDIFSNNKWKEIIREHLRRNLNHVVNARHIVRYFSSNNYLVSGESNLDCPSCSSSCQGWAWLSDDNNHRPP